jgi:thymidylate kinase
MKKRARYICFEGTEGVGKTTQTQLLVDYLRDKNYKVLQTKEPGTNHVPLTMALRNLMLNNEFDHVLTRPAREYISQAIRSIHLEKLIAPAMHEYDYIIQDRGILSGYAYGDACGNNFHDLYSMACTNVDAADSDTHIFPPHPESIYDDVIYLRGDSLKGLQKALTSKQEFEGGDAMESRGNQFIQNVSYNMDEYSLRFNTVRIDVDGKSIETVFNEILSKLNLKDI